MAPGQLAHSLWANLAVRPAGGELAHVLQVRIRQTSHLRELGPQVAREPVDDLAAPPIALLTREDLLADTPIEPDQLLVDGERGTGARSADLPLEARK